MKWKRSEWKDFHECDNCGSESRPAMFTVYDKAGDQDLCVLCFQWCLIEEIEQHTDTLKDIQKDF